MAEERLREMGLDVRFHKLDVSSVESCREIVAFAEQTYGTVDIVVPVAAAFFARAFVDIKESEYDRIVDVAEELVRFTILTRRHAARLVDRYSERKAAGNAVDPAVDLSSIATASQKRSA